MLIKEQNKSYKDVYLKVHKLIQLCASKRTNNLITFSILVTNFNR
jgi:hypothetical protein